MSCPKVSVIIPVYNTEKYLRACLDCVMNQTLRDIEIICVDDGSTDTSPEILREYAASDSRIRIFTQPHADAGVARNLGLRYASGKYLSFLDADDFFEPEMLETAYALAEEEKAEITVFRCNDYNMHSGCFEERPTSILEENLPEKRPFAGVEVKKELFRTFVGWAWDKLFLRKYIVENKILFQEQRTSEDLLFTYFALAKAERITIMDDVFAHHRTHVKTSLEATRAASWESFYKALCALRDALRSSGLYEHFERDFVNYCIHFSLWNLYTLPWPIQEELYYRLKLLWFPELGVPGYADDYYYDKNEYAQYKKIMEEPYSDISPALLKQRIAEREQWLDDMRASVSFRVGRSITWLPRKVRGGVRCFREHGAGYTVRRTLYHMGLWKDEEENL